MDMNNSRQDQFFNDSPIESSLNSIFGAITTENTSSTYLKLSPPPTTLFPVHAFNTLNSLLSRSHWQVPVLPDSQLETILLASINMAKHGEDIYSQDCLRFYSDGLINSFQKIFQDDAVTRWDSHILHFIYANALLAVELCSIKAKSDCLGILELESILFDPNSRFHTRSMISTGVTHEIRYGVHRNVVCRFDDIIKLLPHISISNEEKIECHHQQQEVEQSEKEEKTNLVQASDVLRLCDTASIREYSIPYDDYKDAPILVDFINLFGRSNGFERLKSRFIELDNTCTCNQKEQQNQQDGMQHQQSQETRDKADFISLNLIHTYLHPFALCSNYLSDSVIEDYFKPIISIVVNYLSHLTDDQIKLEAKKETRKDDFITGLYFSLCTLLKRIPLTKEDDVEKIELLCLNMIYRFFQSSSFNGKMNTLNELIRLLPNLNSLRVGQWITDIKLLKLLLRENLHQLQYVEKVEEIIRFMIRKLLLTSNDLDIIWESQIGKHETIIKNIFNMLTRLSLEFSMNQLNYLFNCFKRSWDKATKRQRERLIDLITMLAEQDSDGMMMQKTLDLLWGWAVSLKFSTDLMNASLKAHTKILSCNKSFVCQLRSTWLGKLASFLKIGPNEECLLPAAKQFIEIANIYNTGSLNENTLIQNINQQHNVLKATVDCIIQTMWSVHEERLNALMKMDSISKSSLPTKHTKVLNSNLQLIKVQELLKLLRYLIFQCRLSCTTDLLQQIWDSMLKATFKPDFIVNDQTMLSKYQHQIVLPNDCDLCFRWFTLFFNDPIWLEYRYFIWDNYSVLNPKLMTNAGIKFVIQLFHRINSDNTFIISEFNAPSTIKLLTATSSSLSFTLVNPTVPTTIPTVGINSSMSTVNIKLVNLKQLWNFILYSKKSVYNKTCKLLRHLYTNHISNVDLNRRKDFHIDIMNLCYAHIKAAYNELISSIKKQTSFEVTLPSKLSLSCNPEIESSVFKRILRILKLLKQFTTRLNIEMSVNDIDHCIPLKRSWIGSSFFLTVTCHTMPFLFHASSNDNNEDIVENNKQIDFLDDKTTTITLLVHGNVTLGELRAYLYDFCINGFTANTANVSVPTTMNNNNNTAVSNSNGISSSTGNASDSSSSSGIHCQDSNNILHSMTNSLYQLELSIINKRQTNSVFLLSHNTDRELLVNLLIFLPNWTKKFLDNRDQVNNDAPFIHLELSAKLVYGYISNNYELSTSLTESSTTAPASSLLSRYCLKGFDATEVLTTQQRTNDITLDPLCVTARSNTSNDSNIEEKSDREMASELTIIDSIIDRNLEQEQLANNSNNNNKGGTLFIENKSNIDNSDPLGFTQQLDSDPNREFILNSDQRIEFLLNLSRIALTLNHPNVYHSVMDLLSCMPLHKKLTKFIEDSLIQLVVDKKTNGCDEPSTEPLLSQTWFDDLLKKPNASIGIFNAFSKHVILENTPNFIELLYTLQVLYCLMMPSHWSNSINITLLLLRGGALNLLLSSPYLISSFPLEPLYSPSLNSQNSNFSSSPSTNATTTSLSPSCFVTPFTNNNNDNDNAQIIVYDITVHWKLLCQIRLWLLRIIHVLLLTTANALVLHKLNITPDEFKKSSFYKLLTTSLLLSVKNPNLLSDALQSSLLSLQLSSVTSTTKTMNVDDVEEDVGVDHTEQNIECICKLLLHTYKLATCSTHPVLGGNYFLLLNSVRVAQMTTEFNVPLNEIENCWLKCNYSTLTNLCLTGWQTRYGCENLMEYFKDFNMKHDRIMKLSSWCTEMNNTQENNLLKNKSPSENVLSFNSSSEFLLAENKVKADTNDIIQPIDHSSSTFDHNLSSSTHLCLSVLSLLPCESELSSTVSHSSSSSPLSPTHQLHSFSSSSSYSSNNDNIGGDGKKNTKNKSRSSASTSTSSSSNSTRGSNKANCKGLSKLSFCDFHKQCFHSFRSGNTQGSVIIEALNCIPWYQCLFPQYDFHTFLNSPLSDRMLISNLSENYSVSDHRSRRIHRSNNHHKHSYKLHCYQPVLHPHCPPLQSHFYNYNYRLTGADFLQDLLFSDSLTIRLSTRHCVLMLLTLAAHNNGNNIYCALEQLFNWLPDYVPSKISQSDEYFNLLVQLIPFMRCHEHFLQSTRHWLTEEVVWLRAMVINRHMGSYEASVSNSFIDDVLHCPTTPESVVQDSLVSSTKKEWITFATCRPDKIIHQFHDIPIEEKDLLICGHLRVWVALYQCFIDSSSSLLQLLTEDESKEINDLLKGCVDLNKIDDYHITCVDNNLRTVNTNALDYNNLSGYSMNQLCLVKDILEFILFPASKRYNEIRGSKVSSQVTNQHHIMNSNLENNNSSDSSSKNLTTHFSTSSNLSCSRNLMKCSFDFLLSLTIFNPLVNQLLTSMLYDLVFCANARPMNFNWDYNFGINSSNPTSSLPSSSLFSDNDKNYWTGHHQIHHGDYDRNDNDMNTKAHHFVGLKNGGATCYMNSIIQQLFTLDPIRDCVLSANPEFLLSSSECNETNKVVNSSSTTTCSDDVKPNIVSSSCNTTQSNISHEPGSNPLSKEKIHHLNVLYHMQTIFGHLAYSRIKYYAPVEFWRNFKFRAEAVHVRDQHDALEFFQILGNDLDEALDLCKLPKIVEVVLGGKFADQKICLDCPHRYTSYESFTTLNVDILDHRNLLDSLEQYVKGELLEGENAYNCRMCNKKIPILKRMCIQKLPLVLTIQLKRFDYDWEQGVSLKFNNYCEFPRHLDMFPYTAQGLKDSLDSSFNGIVDGINSNNNDVDSAVANDNDGTFVSTPDNQARTDEVKQVINIINSDEQIDDTNPCTKYNLRGVVVHSGQASSGHYYSFIRHYRPKTKTYKWYKYDDHNVIPVRLDKDKEAVDQWFGGEWKAPQHDMPKFSHLRSGKRWWSAYLLFYEREDFSEQIKKIPIPKLGSTSKQSRLTKRVQDIVDWQNIEHLHYRIQFNPLLPEFIYQLINKNVQLCMVRSVQL
ncbi:putative ubiquitin carboxyl-terminal hydrolase FAF-X [Schistosoma japonicum]|uniref:Putative ubiquitin carboxyl-terminal hydrolase FAF-X n=1 Tax=Schistosoma japonicum TaxID=6182 RepID=A0A4Z2D8C3_SCHJA|nr:putative ubiquitin carboxyl-terminal hydrolase FAF-X [Schistosoma japonicum]